MPRPASSNLTKNPADLAKNPGQALQNVLGGGKKADKEAATTQPDQKPTNAIEDKLGGLLDQGKKKH